MKATCLIFFWKATCKLANTSKWFVNRACLATDATVFGQCWEASLATHHANSDAWYQCKRPMHTMNCQGIPRLKLHNKHISGVGVKQKIWPTRHEETVNIPFTEKYAQHCVHVVSVVYNVIAASILVIPFTDDITRSVIQDLYETSELESRTSPKYKWAVLLSVRKPSKLNLCPSVIQQYTYVYTYICIYIYIIYIYVYIYICVCACASIIYIYMCCWHKSSLAINLHSIISSMSLTSENPAVHLPAEVLGASRGGATTQLVAGGLLPLSRSHGGAVPRMTGAMTWEISIFSFGSFGTWEMRSVWCVCW